MSHITPLCFIGYAFIGQVHVFAGRVKIVSHSSCRTSAIFKYFCPLSCNDRHLCQVIWNSSEAGLQHHMGFDARNSDVVACEQQRRRPACASAQSGQHLCIPYLKSKVTTKVSFLLFLHWKLTDRKWNLRTLAIPRAFSCSITGARSLLCISGTVALASFS